MNRQDYEDIIDLPRPVSVSHPRMPISERAAQFSPFAALTGYDDAIKETGRFTDCKRELEEDASELLNDRLQAIQARIAKHPSAAVTYFCPDEKKEGGEYVMLRGRVKKIDVQEQILIMQDGSRIPIHEIFHIEEWED